MSEYVITVNSTVDLPKEWLSERNVHDIIQHVNKLCSHGRQGQRNHQSSQGRRAKPLFIHLSLHMYSFLMQSCREAEYPAAYCKVSDPRGSHLLRPIF